MSTALVTGGAVRIGAAIAERLAADGYNIVIHCNQSTDAAQRHAKHLQQKHGVGAWVLQADLTTDSDGLIGRAATLAGAPITTLVNNASIYPGSTLETLDEASLQQAMQLHAWVPFALTRQLAAQWPRDAAQLPGAPSVSSLAVVNLLDTRLVDVDAAHLGYHISKAALAEVTRATARLLAPRVRVNGVAPGPILEPVDRPGGNYLDKMAPLMPLEMTPGADAVADAVAFLAAAEGTTAQVVHVDGGRHLGRPIQDP